LTDKILPEGWIETTLGEAFSWGSGGTPKRTNSMYYDGNIPWLIIRDLNDSYVSDSANQITEQGLVNSSAKWVEPGSILIAMYGSIGKLGIATKRLTTNQAIAFTQPGLINGKYLFYYLRSIRTILNNQGKGVAQKNISQTVLNAYPFILAPRLIQDKIVDKVEELFSYIDAGVEGLKQAKAKLQQYRQSVLKDAVTGKLTEKWRELNADKLEPASELLERILEERRANWEAEQLKIFEEKGKTPKDDKWKGKYKTPILPNEKVKVNFPENWEVVSPDMVFASVTDGDHQAPPKAENGIPFLVIGDVKTGKVNIGDKRFVPREYYDAIKLERRPTKGDLLYTVVGSYGIPVKVESEIEFCVQRHIAILKPSTGINRDFYFHLFNSGLVYSQAGDVATGTAQKTVSLGGLRSFKIPLPPAEEQLAISNLVTEKLEGSFRTEATIDQKIRHSASLKSSILSDAFSGELVENIETDESAEQLLEKIKAEKEKIIADKPKATTERKKKVTSERKSLLTVLNEQSEAITPDILMQEAGFTSDDIDDFYVELASIIEKIDQISPEQDILKNWPYEKTSNIKIKLKD
jgi:type I restriction enzyme S subunit